MLHISCSKDPHPVHEISQVVVFCDENLLIPNGRQSSERVKKYTLILNPVKVFLLQTKCIASFSGYTIELLQTIDVLLPFQFIYG